MTVIIVAIFVTYSVYSTNAGELYREFMAQVVRDGSPFTVFSLAQQCGYRNYLRFSTTFRRRMDCSLTSWTKRSNNIYKC